MTVTLGANAHATGRRINLTCRLHRPIPAVADIPPLRLMRRRLAYPVGPADGATVADLRDLYRSPTQPWARLERLQFRTANTPTPDGSPEADVTLYFAAPPPGEPAQARLRFFDPDSQSVVEELVTECSRVAQGAGPVPGWQNREAVELFRTPGGGPEESGGVLEIFQGNADPAVANRFVWTPPAASARTVEFDVQRRWKVDRTEAAALTFETREADGEPGLPWLTVIVERNLDAGTESWSIEVRDRDLDPLVDYYYSLFDFDPALEDPLVARAVALSTQDYDSPRRLFLRLPGAYQRADEPDPTRPTGAPGPLRRFLGPIGHTIDLGRSAAEGVPARHDIDAARLDLLPHLARMIGWVPDLAAPGETQRRDVRSAPEVFGSVGTIPNVTALVNRITRWPCRVKEFVNNVFLTNAPEAIRLWELWHIRHDGTAWSTPMQLTITTDEDGRPAVAVDGAGVAWLFWHSDRGGRRQLWRQRLGGVDAEPSLARAGASDDTADFAAVEEDPAAVWDGSRIWVFWSSNREGQWDVWGRTFAGAPPGSDSIRLTEHPADDRSPAVVFVPGPPDRVWLFWSSRRRGPADIWVRVLDLTSGAWSEPSRLTDSPLRDDRPAATVDSAGRVWLFWTRDAGGRQTLWFRTHDGTDWDTEKPVEPDTGHARDEAPAVVPWKGGLLLLWHSNHNGPWQIWGRFHSGTDPAVDWGEAARLDPNVLGDKEPSAVIDAADHLRVVWRSQRRGRRYRSRTLDVNDADMLEAMGTFVDYVHYTYDTGTDDDDWHARGTVGLYLTPDTAEPEIVEAQVGRVRGFVEPFRPLPVAFRWLPSGAEHAEVMSPDVSVAEEWADETV